MRLPTFTPQNMLDFGAGPGTAIWAALEVGFFYTGPHSLAQSDKYHAEWARDSLTVAFLDFIADIILSAGHLHGSFASRVAALREQLDACQASDLAGCRRHED